MRLSESDITDTNLLIDECTTTSHTENVKTVGNNKFKRASWSPAGCQECGLPPTGKRIDNDHSSNSHRVRMRPKSMRSYHLQQPHQIPLVRPISFNEKYERISNQLLNHNGSLSNQQYEPSIDTSDKSSVTTKKTFTSLPSRKISPTSYERIYTSTTRPLLNAFQQKDSDYKVLSPVLNTNTISLSSPISSFSSSSSSSSPSNSFTCLKGHEESSPSPSSSSPIGSSLNQYPEFALQTPSIDLSPDDSCHPTTTTTRSIMTMSISPNRHHNQIHSSMTNNTHGLKEQQDQKESTIVRNSCLKTHKIRPKKSVHFDWHLPTDIPPSTTNNSHSSIIVTSSSLSTGNSDNDEQKKKNDSKTIKEKERIETTRRTIINTTPLTTIHRSFSLSPSPLSKEENNYNRRHRQVKKENVDELNSTTSRRVTFNNNISPTKKVNGMKNSNGNEMPINTLLVKTSSFNSQTPSITKKSSTTNGFMNFINRRSKRFSADIESLSDKVTINRQKELQSTVDNNINSSNSSNTGHYLDSIRNRNSINLKSNESDSLNNGFLFQPVQSIKHEPFFLTAPKSNDESMMRQTSTLIISTPPQYHYYLYPSKKNSTTNVSMNSISTNTSSTTSSSSSFDFDEDTVSYSTYSIVNQKQVKPVILSDSVQNFWPPPPSPSTLNNDPEQTIMASTVEQNKQFQSNKLKNKCLSSTYNDDSLSMSNGNQTDVLPPTTSLMLNNKDHDDEEEVRSYTEQSSFSNGCLRIASDSSLEDTQASYSERLREKSRSINRPVGMNVTNYSLSRSRSKDMLNKQCENLNSSNRNILRPKSAGQVHAQVLLSPIRQEETSNDFQSKRQFFENRTYIDYIPTSNRIYTHSPQRHVTK